MPTRFIQKGLGQAITGAWGEGSLILTKLSRMTFSMWVGSSTGSFYKHSVALITLLDCCGSPSDAVFCRASSTNSYRQHSTSPCFVYAQCLLSLVLSRPLGGS